MFDANQAFVFYSKFVNSKETFFLVKSVLAQYKAFAGMKPFFHLDLLRRYVKVI